MDHAEYPIHRPNAASAGSPVSDVPNSRPLILIVDDEEGIRNFAQHVAESVGLATLCAGSGSEALGLLKGLSPSIIIMDMQMPNGDGVQLIQGIAGLGIKAKVVLMSGADNRLLQVTSEIARQRGIDISAVLNKPVRFNDLRKCLATLYTSLTPFSAEVLREALTGTAPILHYQPKIRLSDCSLVGVEALLRLKDTAGRPVSPDMALSVAEESGLMPELNRRVFESAIAQCAVWREQGMPLEAAINLCASGSFDLELPARLEALCAARQVPTGDITIEMTESALDRDNLVAMENMVRLRLMGFRLSIDDFGTGHSSLVRLRQLPFSELKIDKSFVMTLASSEENGVIVRSLAQMAQNLGLHSVIEGVEDEVALKFAREVGVNEAQGFHIARPMPAEEIAQFAKSWQWRRAALENGGRTGRAEPDAAEAASAELRTADQIA